MVLSDIAFMVFDEIWMSPPSSHSCCFGGLAGMHDTALSGRLAKHPDYLASKRINLGDKQAPSMC